MKQHLDMCTYEVGTQQKDDGLQLFITARNIAGIYRVIFSCFNFVYCPILFT